MAEEDVIDAVCHRIKFDKDKLERGELETIEVDSFNLSDFWNQFGAAVQALSNEVTKIGFMCGKKPFPKSSEVSSMVQDMFQYYNVMRELYMVLPEEVGVTVYKAVKNVVKNIITSLLDFSQSLKDLTDKGAKERLIVTATFWDACNSVETLPKNNLLATLMVLEEESALAADAQEELNTTIEEDQVNLSEMGDVENSDLWTNPERDLATKAVGLVKVTHVCLQRLRKAVTEYGSCATSHHCSQLDRLVQAVRTVSPALDDFVSELYHPVDFISALNNAQKLVQVLRSLLSSIEDSHYEEGINKDTVNSLLHFINHNHHKLDPDATNPLPQLSNLNIKT